MIVSRTRRRKRTVGRVITSNNRNAQSGLRAIGLNELRDDRLRSDNHAGLERAEAKVLVISKGVSPRFLIAKNLENVATFVVCDTRGKAWHGMGLTRMRSATAGEVARGCGFILH